MAGERCRRRQDNMLVLSCTPNSLGRSGNMAETHRNIAVEALAGFRQSDPFVLPHEQVKAKVPL
ncbi:hypothetical protein NKK46_30975 [Mesorhizobium sp. M0013]